MIKIIKGNIFTTQCSTIVNTVNCVGVMGAGIAFEFRLRYPKMFEKYKEYCSKKYMDIGKLWLYKPEDGEKQVLNFPTKYHWKYPSKLEYLEKGLEKFVSTYKEKNIDSIAFPLLGAANGGISGKTSIQTMKRYLDPLDDILIEVYLYDPNAEDDLYKQFKQKFETLSEREIADKTKLRIDFVSKLKSAIESENINSLSALSKIKGLGIKTLEKSFKFIMTDNSQPTLF